jgi:phospholipase A1
MYNSGSIILINKDCKLSSPIAKFFISVFVTASIVTGASAQTEKETAPSPLVQEQDIELEKVISTEQNETIEATKDSLDNTLLDEKIDNEREANRNLYSLVQHRQNYLLPISYSTGPNPITLDGAGAEQVDRFEAKYQISVKTPLWLQEDDVSGAYFGFTAVSFWQLYNDETSKPFRETNYEPEIFYQFSSDLTLLGYKFNMMRIGLNHMSNGQSGLKSRSWNRITATALLSDENTAYYLKTWYRLPEDEKTSPLDPLGDDNPDINDYYGRIELGFGFQLGELALSSKIRNNLSFKDNRSGVEINVTYPINDRYDFLVQYFNGYGDSLIDYNRHQQRISAGMQIRFL